MQPDAAAPSLIDGRYRLDGVLGRGGMSTVYRAWDARAERPCALKCLTAHASERLRQLSALFQREFATLSQLAHPSIIEVYDYGLDAFGPYYTMELLEGNDLRRLAPLPWRTACRLLREVASALALLHSRRLIHRDVTAANVHCTADGRAKLMDFGAMTDVGVTAPLVGTPPYVAPEALHGQALDERVDLFALGALAYLTLTGRNAYPASSVTQLHEVWRVRPEEPSALSPDVPPGLSELAMALLSLDARARPGSAAEVIERLTAIADLPRDGRLDTARAYLIMPPLIGRERELQTLRWQLTRAQRGEGGALLCEAHSGMGKSRMLETFALEARQSGALSLRAHGAPSRGHDFALLQALADALLETAPELAARSAQPHAAVLGHVLPELHAALGRPALLALDRPKLLHARVQAAALAWFQAVAREQWLALSVDDVQDADAPSLLLLVELARAAPTLKLQLAVGLRAGCERRAGKLLELLRAACVHVPLGPLDAQGCEDMVRALLGDVSNVKLVAGWADSVAQGNPQAILELVQHLLDSGVARYENGRFTLGPELAQQRLPRSLTDTHHARVQALSPSARALAEALSLAIAQSALDLAVYPELFPEQPALRVYAALDELVARRFVVASGAGHVFAHRELAAAVAAGVADERARTLQRALAAIEQRRGQPLQAAYYLQQCGADAEALELMLEHVAQPGADPTGRGFALTPAGLALLQRALRMAERSACAPQRLFFLRKRMLQLSVYIDVDLGPVADHLLAQLRTDAGLDLFDASDPDPAQLVSRCLPRAQQRHDALPESLRGLAPLDAVRELAHAVAALTGAYGRVLDSAGMLKLHALLVPLRNLVPAVTLLHDITEAAGDRVRGRRFSGRIDPVLTRLTESVPGLDEITREAARRTLTYYLALEQAQLCNPKVLAYADFIAEDPVYEALAWHLRMVKHLYSGEALRARACRDRTELLALRQPEGFSQLATSVLYETEARTLCGDLLALKEALPRLEQLAGQSPGFRGFALTVRAEYDMLRGRSELACEALSDVLAVATPGETTEWSRAVTSYVEGLLRIGELDRAVEHAQRACEQSVSLRLNPLYPVMLRASMAQALARRGDGAEARTQLELALGDALSLGMDGVPLGCLHEAAARVALAVQDEAALASHLEHARVQYTRGGDPQLVRKHQRLLADARRAGGGAAAGARDTALSVTTTRAGKAVSAVSALNSIPPGPERIELGLSLLVGESGAEGACLYALDGDRPRLVARHGACTPDAITGLVAQHLSEALLAHAGPAVTHAATQDLSHATWRDAAGADVRPLLLTARRGQRTLVAGVLALWGLPAAQVPQWPLILELTEALLELRAAVP